MSVLYFLFGSPRALFFAHVLNLISALAPCRADDTACAEMHREAAQVIADVALEDADPEDVVDRLVGAGAHETGFRTRVQDAGGPAVSWFQLEVPVAQRPALLADDRAAARLALVRARTCGGSMVGYAGGRCNSKHPRVLEVAAQLRRCVESARRDGAWVCRNWREPSKSKKVKRLKGGRQ